LERLKGLDLQWVFRGHRQAVKGADVKVDLAAAIKRLDNIEEAIIRALGSGKPQNVARVTRAVLKDVLGLKAARVPEYAAVSVGAFLLDMAHRGLVKRNADREWLLEKRHQPLD
jgi:hypothetical protein